MKRFAHLYLFTLFLLLAGFMNAQKFIPTSSISNKKSILIRPNSRDYGPNLRNNFFQRVENKRDASMFIKKRPAPPQFLFQQNNTNLKNKQNLQGRQINVFRR